MHPKGQQQVDSILRKIRALRLDRWERLVWSSNDLRKAVASEVRRIMHVHKRRVLKKWRTQAALWHGSDSAVYKFLWNPLPVKTVSIREGEDIHVHPDRLEASLLEQA